ncbi:hypothetical protein SAMN05421777_12735 [Fluoribacter gormanii]|uniref:Uncharacterized protein n=1 Tax=Fluoribacter gormanii TaxID=464 RepID=A0A377GGJ8_9GAMM|nr:hypothetical protein SAMN05421777_12735 [Fluoribacter gormanii]STO23906.1 Uncharacterised protein [Fluoribacter gormanii]
MLLLKPGTKRLSTKINDFNCNPESQPGLPFVSPSKVIGIGRV